jgi:Tfp pilus assembly protein PilX
MSVKRASIRMSLTSDESGSTLVAVMAVVVLVAIVSTTILSSTINAMGVSTSSRASAQSVAAAEAGVDSAELGLRTPLGCVVAGGRFDSSAAPHFSARVSYLDSTGWHEGCPDGHQATKVKVVSQGGARDHGVAGRATGDTARMEAVYPYTPASGSITPTGPAIFAGGTDTINDVTVTDTVTSGSTTGDLVLDQGSVDLTCQSGTTIAGNLIVKNGDISLNACVVLGDLHVGGFVKLNGSTVHGNVIAAGLSGHLTEQSAVGYIYNSTVGKNLTVGGKVYVQSSKIMGNLVAKTLRTVTNVIAADVLVRGNVTLSGSLSRWGLCNLIPGVTNLVCGLLGSVTTRADNVASVPGPSAATSWRGYAYRASDWTSLGFTEKVWTGSCTIDSNPESQRLLSEIEASTRPIVVNATSCARLLFSNSAALRLKLHADVAFVARGFGMENLSVDSAVAARLSLWFIVPGASSLLNASLCLDANVLNVVDINSSVRIGDSVNALVYTPGCLKQDSVAWHGQEYAGWIHNGSDISVDYHAVGLPGVNLDGGSVPTISAASLGVRETFRELADD